jgi:hypothetical protein
MTIFRTINGAIKASRKFRDAYEPHAVFKAEKTRRGIVVSAYLRNHKGELFFASYV